MYILIFEDFGTNINFGAYKVNHMVDKHNKDIPTVLCASGEKERLRNFAPTITVSGLNSCLVFGARFQVSNGFSTGLFQLIGGCRVKQQFCPIIVPLKYEDYN